MMNEQYYLNRGCDPTQYDGYLDKNNWLSEFESPQDKEKVRNNLGISDIVNELENKIDNKVIERGNLVWDLTPTEGNTNRILSSDALYKAFLNYSLKDQVDENIQEIWTAFLNKLREFKNDIEQDLNELNCDSTKNLNKIKKQVDNFTAYVELQLNIIKKEVESSNIKKLDVLEKRIKSVETQLKTITTSGGTALTDVFGNSDDIGITLRTLTNALNKVWEKIGEMSGENYKGITFNLKPEYFFGTEGCTVHVTASTQNTSGIFEKLQLYLDGLLITEVFNTEYFEYDFDIDKTSTIMCKATILGIEYTKIKTVAHYNSFWMGSGKTYLTVMNPYNLIIFDDNFKGNYDITFNLDDYLFIIVGDSLDGFIRADMNGIEIPLSKLSIVIDDILYKIFTSKNTYNAGRYNIDINS